MIPKSFALIALLVNQINGQEPTLGSTPDSTSAAPSTPGVGENEVDGFLIPEYLSEHEEGFTYKNQTEFIVVKNQMTFQQAGMYCEANLGGRLAQLVKEEAAKFLAKGLAENNEELDFLWIGLTSNANRVMTWIDSNNIDSNQSEPFDNATLSKYIVTRDDQSRADLNFTRGCVAFGRNMHDTPLLVDLGCGTLRGFVCERPASGVYGKGPSSHRGWIPGRDWDYKIFTEKIMYADAQKRCFQMDVTATLAVVPSIEDVKKLGRYLLIGRPSFENAWIGARYVNDSNKWLFEGSNEVIAETRGADSYPPWRLDHQVKHKGCALLDRHLSNETLFVEARCARLRPYICSKRKNGGLQNSSDHSNVGDKDYRLYFDKKPFQEAKEICMKDGGKLTEMKTSEHVSDVIKIMGDNRTTVNNVWVGCEYKDGAWTYSSDVNPMDASLNQFLEKNSTYNEDADSENVCMSLDRENHLSPIIYGTRCVWEQSFVCEWPLGKMPRGIELNKETTTTTTTTTTTQITQIIPREFEETIGQ